MSKYDKKSNRWIAIEVAKATGKRVSVATEFHDGDGILVYPHSNQINFDPCNNHDDAYPVIEGSDMVLVVNGTACISELGIKYQCEENLLRSAMICFLKMKESENG